MRIRKPRELSDTFDVPFLEGVQFDLVGFGQNAVDHMCVVPQYPHFDTKTQIAHYEKLAGGQTATAVCFVSRMGLRGKYIGKVGSDDMGVFSLQSLRAEAIDTSSVVMVEGARNQYAFIIIDKSNGERTILWQRDPLLTFKVDELRRDEICCAKVLHIDGHDTDAAIQAAAWANEAGVPVVIDLDRVVPRCAELIAKVDFLITSAMQ